MCVIFQVNTTFGISQQNIIFTLENLDFYTRETSKFHLTLFVLTITVCVISNFLISQQNIDIFKQKSLYLVASNTEVSRNIFFSPHFYLI